MKKKRIKIGILFPDGDVKWLLFGTPSKDGYLYGVSYADTHITALSDSKSISFHLTYQKLKKWQRLGEIIKDGNYENILFTALNPKQLMDDDLDEDVVYITKRGMELLNQPSDIMKESETDQERIIILDMLRFFNNSSFSISFI